MPGKKRGALRRRCPHSLRGLHSTLAVSAGATAEAVAASLGHASFATTVRHYVAPSVLERAGSERVLAVLAPAPPAIRPDLAQLVTGLSREERAQLASLLAADADAGAVRSEAPAKTDRTRKRAR